MEDFIAREMDSFPHWQLVAWASDLLSGECMETEKGMSYTIHHRKGTQEFDRKLVGRMLSPTAFGRESVD
ncbi:MAG: hypothetical protein R3D34_09770 [Nitratireductor sp.]